MNTNISILAQCDASRWTDFLNIQENDPQQVLFGEEQDLFIGKNKKITLNIPNGQTRQFRDIVVMGTLIIQSSNASDTAVKGQIIFRDCIIPGGEVTFRTINANGRNMLQCGDIEFKEELKKLISNWLASQKEIADKIV